eukprot:1438924-Prymnesium_polylepis.1
MVHIPKTNASPAQSPPRRRLTIKRVSFRELGGRFFCPVKTCASVKAELTWRGRGGGGSPKRSRWHRPLRSSAGTLVPRITAPSPTQAYAGARAALAVGFVPGTSRRPCTLRRGCKQPYLLTRTSRRAVMIMFPALLGGRWTA